MCGMRIQILPDALDRGVQSPPCGAVGPPGEMKGWVRNKRRAESAAEGSAFVQALRRDTRVGQPGAIKGDALKPRALRAELAGTGSPFCRCRGPEWSVEFELAGYYKAEPDRLLGAID